MWNTAIVEGRRYPDTQFRDVYLGGRVYTRFRGHPGSLNPAWTMVTVNHSDTSAQWWARAFC